ncbi:MAG: insulinase family protein [Bryobacterales bacterium]|nr:insulinase family protein [Bryobacterales bacterium]
MSLIALPDHSPLITLRVTYHTGTASDPPGGPGTCWMTALMLSAAGTRRRTYKQILDATFPMAAAVSSIADKEMITFCGETHGDHLGAFFEIFREMILDPGWREDDFRRLRDEAINWLATGLRGENDEELGKEVLHQEIFSGHPYGWQNAGTVSSLEKLTLDDVREFYQRNVLPARVTVGIAGGYPERFAGEASAGFLSGVKAETRKFGPAPEAAHSTAVFVEKPARGVAISFGFPIDVRRGGPDYLPLLLATSALGQHRMSSGRLFTRMRQLRGLNYGDYAYIEHFPGGMFTLEPAPNVARSRQVFQIWIRPVEPESAHFSLRLALFELRRLVSDGLAQDEFERTRSFLSKHVNLLLSSKAAELGYAIDSEFYGGGHYPAYVRRGLAALTRDEVNAAVRRHLKPGAMRFAIVAENAARLRDQILSGTPSPITYNAPKPQEILAEDKIVETWPVPVHDARIVPVEEVFA